MNSLKKLLLLATAGVVGGLAAAKLSAALERDWTIRPSALGDITLGSPLPLFVFGMSPNFYQSDYADGIPYIGCEIPSRDVSIRLGFFILVQGIIPGPDYRTAQSTGQGSTLEDLRTAHGTVELSHIPEPYTCVAKTPDLPDVYFEFTDCEAAESGEGVARVHIWTRMD